MLRVELDGPDDTIIAQFGQLIYKVPGVSRRMTIPGENRFGCTVSTHRLCYSVSRCPANAELFCDSSG